MSEYEPVVRELDPIAIDRLRCQSCFLKRHLLKLAVYQWLFLYMVRELKPTVDRLQAQFLTVRRDYE